MQIKTVTVLLALTLGACSEETTRRDAAPGSDASSDLPVADGSPDAATGEDGPTPDTRGDISVVEPDTAPQGSPGCGKAASHPLGGVQVTHTFSTSAGGERGFFLSLPKSYAPQKPHRVIVAYSGTNWVGKQIRPYFKFESGNQVDEIFVYPDPEWHDFSGWGNLGGWLLGPHASPAHGTEDIAFTRELLDLLEANYCVDKERIFATGHSWGGDMAAVVACFLGDRFRASAPAAANRPYWFEPSSGPVGCAGSAAVWTFFGQNETHFTWQTHPGEFGDEQVAFWKQKHGCGSGQSNLGVGAAGECVSYDSCAEQTRYCYYEPAAGHQIPSYFSTAVLQWFRSF